MEKNSFEKIYEVVKQIPPGTVASYGQVAMLAGNARWARVVGYALHAVNEADALPCHRVVTRDGSVSDAFMSNGKNRQVELLKKEGVKFTDGKVDMKKYQWKRLIF